MWSLARRGHARDGTQSIDHLPDDLSHQSHRQLIGYLGILLPLILILLAGLRPTPGLPRWEPLNSISAYYYTGAVAAFVGILFALALFLFTYRGYRRYKADRVAGMLGGSAALGVVLFPTGGGPGMGDDLEVKVLPEPGRRDRREAQGVRREAYAERSVKRTRESTNRNRIRGAADRGERTTDREAPATKGKRRRSGDCAGKVIVLTRGGLA